MRHIIIFVILLTSQAQAQVPKSYNHTSDDVHVIHSKVLNQDRHFYVNAPKLDSGNVNTPLPVLYLLDGENHFHIVSAYVDYLSHWKIIPPMIVVGIINENRVKDLTPSHGLINFDGKVDSNYKTSGGNAPFFYFIQEELMPYIAANYKTDSFNIFAGHSFGGVTVINCLLTHPDMFDAYIAVSPSLWFDNKYVLRLAQQKLRTLPTHGKKLYYSVGNEDGSFRNDALQFKKLVDQYGLKKIESMYRYYPNEDHMSEPIPAYYDALRFIYKTYKQDKTK